MAITTKQAPKDPLDLIKNQRCTSDDVLLWINQANREFRREREALESVTDPTGVAAHVIRLRMNFWSETVDRLLGLRDLMSRG